MTTIDCTKERFQLATNRQVYHSDRMQAAFTFYFKVFTTLSVASFALVSSKSPIKLQEATASLFLYTIASLISLIGVVSIVQIILSLISWKGWRDLESEICPDVPKVSRRWWLFETLYIIIIIVSLIISWFGVAVLLDLIHN